MEGPTRDSAIRAQSELTAVAIAESPLAGWLPSSSPEDGKPPVVSALSQVGSLPAGGRAASGQTNSIAWSFTGRGDCPARFELDNSS